MSHSNTQRLTDYWRARRGILRAPLRSAIDPADFVDLLPQVFILGRQGVGHYAFRLAGRQVEDTHGRSLRRAEFSPLWSPFDRPQLHAALEGALSRGQALVIEAQGAAFDGRTAEFEILLAPMVSRTGIDRFLGLYQPLSPLSRLDGEAVARLAIRTIRPLAAADGVETAHPPLRLAAVDGRNIA
jgi:hypothetical protein